MAFTAQGSSNNGYKKEALALVLSPQPASTDSREIYTHTHLHQQNEHKSILPTVHTHNIKQRKDSQTATQRIIFSIYLSTAIIYSWRSSYLSIHNIYLQPYRITLAKESPDYQITVQWLPPKDPSRSFTWS